MSILVTGWASFDINIAHETMSLLDARILLISLVLKYGFGQPRINQGREIDITDAPYMARVRFKISDDYGGILKRCTMRHIW